jgi:hypothetical protein
MSRGPGQIERTIAAVFDSDPATALTTEELCRHVYGLAVGAVRKEHRVAVIRAGKRLALRRPELGWLQSTESGRPLVFYRRGEVSEDVAREKAALPALEIVPMQGSNHTTGGRKIRVEVRNRDIPFTIPKNVQKQLERERAEKRPLPRASSKR